MADMGGEMFAVSHYYRFKLLIEFRVMLNVFLPLLQGDSDLRSGWIHELDFRANLT